jgi:hypothetical protein
MVSLGAQVAGESTCRHCGLPIKLIKQHALDAGRWFHMDGHRAVLECRNLVATPPDPEPAARDGEVRGL